MRSRCLLFGLALLAGCQSAPRAPEPAPARPAVETSRDLRAEYRALAAAGGTAYETDASTSRLLIHVFRGGRAAKLGHNHVISAPSFEGFAHVPSEDATAARFDIRVPLDALVVDDPALRTETGGAFAGTRSADDIEGTRRNMLGERGLDAARFPYVHLKSVTIAGDWPWLLAEVDVTVRDVTKRQPVLLRVERGPQALKVKGSLLLRQSDFGITPFALFGGVLAVQDAVAVEFELRGAELSQ